MQAVLPFVLNYVAPLDPPRPKKLRYYPEVFNDQEKHFNILFLHVLIFSYALTIVNISVDVPYVSCTQHLLALFDIVGLDNFIFLREKSCIESIAINLVLFFYSLNRYNQLKIE